MKYPNETIYNEKIRTYKKMDSNKFSSNNTVDKIKNKLNVTPDKRKSYNNISSKETKLNSDCIFSDTKINTNKCIYNVNIIYNLASTFILRESSENNDILSNLMPKQLSHTFNELNKENNKSIFANNTLAIAEEIEENILKFEDQKEDIINIPETRKNDEKFKLFQIRKNKPKRFSENRSVRTHNDFVNAYSFSDKSNFLFNHIKLKITIF